jgi:hypothetical protein
MFVSVRLVCGHLSSRRRVLALGSLVRPARPAHQSNRRADSGRSDTRLRASFISDGFHASSRRGAVPELSGRDPCDSSAVRFEVEQRRRLRARAREGPTRSTAHFAHSCLASHSPSAASAPRIEICSSSSPLADRPSTDPFLNAHWPIDDRCTQHRPATVPHLTGSMVLESFGRAPMKGQSIAEQARSAAREMEAHR